MTCGKNAECKTNVTSSNITEGFCQCKEGFNGNPNDRNKGCEFGKFERLNQPIKFLLCFVFFCFDSFI